MKYTAEEVRQYARITDGMVSLPKLSDMLTELAKRIKADEGVANKLVVPVAWMCETVNGYKVFNAEGPSFPCNAGVVSELFTYPPAQVEPTEAVISKAVEVFLDAAPEWNDYLVKDGMRAALLAVWPSPPAQAAQSVDIEAIREVIESHINKAKNLRHDPESQDYLYEQADKLEAALPELKP